MLSRGDLTIKFPNIRQRTQETPYRAIPSANKSSIIRGELGGWCCKESANGGYIAKLPPMRKYYIQSPTWLYIGLMTSSSVRCGFRNLPSQWLSIFAYLMDYIGSPLDWNHLAEMDAECHIQVLKMLHVRDAAKSRGLR